MCHNKKLRERSLQSWKPQSVKHSVHLNQFTNRRMCSVHSALQHHSADIATPGRLGPRWLKRWAFPVQRRSTGEACWDQMPLGCAALISRGLKLWLACEQVHEQQYLHNSYAKWHDRGSLLGSAAPSLAQAETKAIQSWFRNGKLFRNHKLGTEKWAFWFRSCSCA